MTIPCRSRKWRQRHGKACGIGLYTTVPTTQPSRNTHHLGEGAASKKRGGWLGGTTPIARCILRPCPTPNCKCSNMNAVRFVGLDGVQQCQGGARGYPRSLPTRTPSSFGRPWGAPRCDVKRGSTERRNTEGDSSYWLCTGVNTSHINEYHPSQRPRPRWKAWLSTSTPPQPRQT